MSSSSKILTILGVLFLGVSLVYADMTAKEYGDLGISDIKEGHFNAAIIELT